MKIGSLFIALGFQVENQAAFDKAERGLTSAAGAAAKLAAGVNVVNAAMLALESSAIRVAMALHNFSTTTGLSADGLQRWQQAGILAGNTAQGVTQAVVALQDAQNAFALGEPQNVGAWSLLGVDPRQNPFQVLDALRNRVKDFKDLAIARALLGKVGLESLLPTLQLPEAEFARLRKQALLNPGQVDALVKLNREFQILRINLTTAANSLAAALAPALAVASRLLAGLSRGLAALSDWLSSNATAARIARFALGGLAVALLAVGAALAVLTAALGALIALSALASPALFAILAALSPVPLVVGLLGAAFAALALLLDDFWTAAAGGKSAFNWGVSLKVVDLLAAGIERALAAWDKLVSGIRAGQGIFEKIFTNFASDDTTFRVQNEENRGAAWFAPTAAGGNTSSKNFAQTNNVQVRVDGSRSPEATARATGAEIDRRLSAAAYQAPVPNY